MELTLCIAGDIVFTTIIKAFEPKQLHLGLVISPEYSIWL